MKQKVNLYWILIFAAAVFWGTAGLFVRPLQSSSIADMEIVFVRAVFTTVLLALIISVKDVKLFKINIKDLWIFILDGICSIVLFNFSYYMTISLTSLSIAAVLMYTAPFFVVIIYFILYGNKITVKKALACIIAFVGCCLVSEVFDSTLRISGKALFFGLLTGFGYALYTVFSDILIKKGYKSLTITFYVFLFAMLGSIPFIDFSQFTANFGMRPAVILFFMAIINTVLPFLLYTTGLAHSDPTAALIIATLEPVVATVIGAVKYGENLTLGGAVGIILVFVSVGILNIDFPKKRVSITANAKINLTLDVTGKREDGYHTLDTVMQSVSLADRIILKKQKGITVICSDASLSGQDNIAYKAAQLFFCETGITGGIHIYIKKHIPCAAGLGGGSADAAAVLLGLDTLYKTKLSPETLNSMAAKLGADVPFFIKGGTQRAGGTGEILTPVCPLKKGYFVIAKADTKPSTKEMYKRLDSEAHISVDTQSAIKACENGDLKELSTALGNSFSKLWENNRLYELLCTTKALGVSLSGSGPSFFAVFDSLKAAKDCKKQLKNHEISGYITTPCESAIIFD